MAIEKKAKKQPKVPVFIPKSGPGDDARFISVNGKRIMVKTNTQVMLEPKYAEVLQNSLSAEEEALAYIEANENNG